MTRLLLPRQLSEEHLLTLNLVNMVQYEKPTQTKNDKNGFSFPIYKKKTCLKQSHQCNVVLLIVIALGT